MGYVFFSVIFGLGVVSTILISNDAEASGRIEKCLLDQIKSVVDDPMLGDAIPANYVEPYLYAEHLSPAARECFSVGYCQPMAIANVTGEEFVKVAEKLAILAKSSNPNGNPTRLSLDNYIYNHPMFRGQSFTTYEGRETVIRKITEAMNEQSGEFAYFIYYPGHVESVYKGKISYPFRYITPLGASPKSMKRRLIETLDREGVYKVKVIKVNR